MWRRHTGYDMHDIEERGTIERNEGNISGEIEKKKGEKMCLWRWWQTDAGVLKRDVFLGCSYIPALLLCVCSSFFLPADIQHWKPPNQCCKSRFAIMIQSRFLVIVSQKV